jgi:hypothetical protein
VPGAARRPLWVDNLSSERGRLEWICVMAEAPITDQEISILCDVLEGWGANLNADKSKILDQLIAKGLVVPADQESAKYKLTGIAQQLLAEHGVGMSGG